MLMAGVAYAGYTQPAAVTVDLDGMFAAGDQYTARTSKNDTEMIGCGVATYDDGTFSFISGFCQARDSEGVGTACFTQDPDLLDAMRATSAFAYISFGWQDDGFGGAECTRVRYSTQSFYLPNFTTKGKN